MKTQICKVCKMEKPFDTGYYANSNKSGRDTTCKACRKKQKAKQRNNRKSLYAEPNHHEATFIQACIANGIHAQPTSDFRNHKFNDVIAWGCVRIEFKYPAFQNDGNLLIWRFTKKQHSERLPADLIVLASNCFDGLNYHFFDPLHPVFFNPNQTRKVGISYTVNRAKDYHKVYGVIMTKTILKLSQDNWHLIEKLRLEKSQTMKQQALRGVA